MELLQAAYYGQDQMVQELIRAGADVNGKDKDYKQTALHKASSKGHSSVVKTLAEAGANPNVLDWRGVTPLMRAAAYGHDRVVQELIRAGADVNGKGNNKRTALHWASWWGHSSVVKTLAEAGANLNVQDELGMTPLMWAADWGYANVVVELIRAGADVSVVSSSLWLSVAAGSTALHFAAAKNSIECGVLLVEAGADMKTRNKNSKSPLDPASFRFRRAIQQAQSFSTKRIVAVIGNGEHGKSTLIAALQAEGNSLLKQFANRFTKVQNIKKRTTGVEAVQFSSEKYGDTLFYDFAGQSNYHGPHQSFLEAILNKQEVSVSLLLLVKATDEENIITQQVTHWLQPLSLTSAPSTPQVILVGSFLDQVESREEATEKLLRCTQSVQEQFHFNIQGPCLLDCRKPASEGIDQICTFLQEAQPLQLNSISFSYSLHWVLAQLRRSLSLPAITLDTFQSWLLKDAKLVLKNFPPAEQMCRDLTAVGHALFLPNKQDPSHSWLILDLQAILHDVYGTLFSGSQGKVNQFGLLHCSQLTELFPKLEPAMVQEVLISLEFCIRVDSSLLREELLKLTARDEGDNWLYFPALVSALPLEIFPNVPDPHHLQWACWQLRAAEKHFISAHLLQTIILRLAANHVFTHKLSPSVREHCCSVWMNGLSWVSNKGVDVAVQISDSSVVQVVGRTEEGPEKLYQYLSTIVSDVIKTTAQLSPKLEATSYIVHPYTPAMWECAKSTPPDSLYPVSSIIDSISDGGDYVLTRTRQGGRLPHRTSLTELFGGWSPPLSVVQDMDFKKEPQRAPLSSAPPPVPSSSSSQSGPPTVAEGEATVPEDGEGPGQVPTPEGLSPPASTGGAAQTKSQAGVTALQVLDEFRDQFIQNMDSNAVVLDLLHHDIISKGDQRTITRTEEPTEQNKFLHLYLKEKCTEDAFHLVCDIISNVKGNPEMSALGTAMKRRLATEAVVAFDYDAQLDDELTLRVGQVLRNVRVVDEGWAEGELFGKVGMFPSNFVKMRKASPEDRPLASLPHEDSSPPPVAVEAKKLFRAIFDYSPANEDELTLKVGDIVEFLGHEEEGWYSGQLKGQTGVFPFNYVEELPSPGSVSSAPTSSVSTTDGKQLSSITVSEILSDKSLISIPKGSGLGTPNHDDPTPPISAGAHAPISIDSHHTLEDINKVNVCEMPSSATISSAPTTDGKQLPSVTMSKTHPDTPLVPIAKEGGAAIPHRDDPTPPTSADTPTHFSIDSHPTLEDINKFIVREVAADWKQVATFLGVEPSVIRIADTDHRRCEHACTDIFERWLSWKQGTGRKKRTWHTVLSAVEEAGHKAFSQQLQTKVLHLQ